MIKVGQTWETRSGERAEVIADRGPNALYRYVVDLGIIQSEVYAVTETGHWVWGEETDHDLVTIASDKKVGRLALYKPEVRNHVAEYIDDEF